MRVALSATRQSFVRLLLLLGALLALLIALQLGMGRADLSDPELRSTLLELRASRVAAAFLTGAALATGGVIVQGLFRNPLASPSILGTTAGAALGGRLSLLLFQLAAGGTLALASASMLLSLGCLLGALGALLLLLAVTRFKRDLIVLLLTGFLLSSLFLSLGGFITSIAQDRWELARAMISFALGDVTSVGVDRIALALPLIVAGVIAARLWARPLDMLLTGEDEAASLGLDVVRVRRWCVIWVAVLTGAAVAIGGNVGFVGLIVPHALRPYVGIRHARLVPAAALGGGVFVVGCDWLSRVIPSATEIPLGVVTGVIGAPLFLTLLVRSRRREAFGDGA